MRNLTVLFLLLVTHLCNAEEYEYQQMDLVKIEIKTMLDDTLIFPEKCLGIWDGVMFIFNEGLLRDSVQVRFTAAKTEEGGVYIWKTAYLSPTRPMVKDYKLVVRDLSKGQYILDEGDGVEVMHYVVQNKMYSLFQVDDIYLTSSTEFLENQLIFEVTSGRQLNASDEVKNYSFANIQRVVLKKVD